VHPLGRVLHLSFWYIGKKVEIKPYSPVNVIGKITSKDVKIPINLDDKKITFRSSC